MVLTFFLKNEVHAVQDSLFYTYSYDSTYKTHVFLKQVRYFYDKASSYSINDVVNFPSTHFVLVEELGDSVKAQGCYWARFKLENKTGRYLHEALSVTTSTKSFTVYKNVNGHFEFAAAIDREMTRDERMLPFMVNQLPITFGLNETVEFIVCIESKKSYASKDWHPLFSWNEKIMVQSKLNHITSQLFFTGVYLVFILMSLVIFFAFRDKIFIYFSLFILSAAYYFMAAKGLLTYYFGFEDSGFWFASRLELGIIGLVTSVALFINEYILFKKNLPKLFTASTVVAIGYLLLAIADRFFSNHLLIIYKVQNTLLPIWILLVLFSSVLLIRRRLRAAKILFISIIILALSAMLDAVNYLVGGGLTWTRDAMQFGVFGFSSVLFYGLFDKITSIQKEKTMHKIEKEKSNELLFNILPADVAKELIDTGEYKAKQMQQASVLFTDFKGFTQIAAKLNAVELVKEINICFQAFDHICAKYGVEKIKTIGDAYMAAAGLKGHSLKDKGQSFKDATNLVSVALEMQHFMTLNFKPGTVNFEMRCGIHTGPVVAGIVGETKFQYDIWGDTVNTASRMESASEVGKVNVSQATYLLLKEDPDFTFESRGKIEVKGKGELEMYFIELKAQA